MTHHDATPRPLIDLPGIGPIPDPVGTCCAACKHTVRDCECKPPRSAMPDPADETRLRLARAVFATLDMFLEDGLAGQGLDHAQPCERRADLPCEELVLVQGETYRISVEKVCA